MNFRIKFGEWNNTTAPGLDGVEYGFTFEVVNAALIGKPEEKANTQAHRGLVSISRTRLAAWHLVEQDIPKVLFEFAKREIEQLVAMGGLLPKEQFTFRLLTLSTHNAPDECPFDPAMIHESIGFEVTVKGGEPVVVTSRDGKKRRLL